MTQSNQLPAFPRGRTAWALFLDVDGTLLEIAPSPDGVHVPDTLGPLLAELETGLGGALALVSGRSIEVLDELFAPRTFCLAGVHGAEWRTGGTVRRIAADPGRLDPVREAFRQCADAHPGTGWEDKRFALTLHYRQNPDVESAVRAMAQSWGRRLGDEFEVLDGKMIVEVRFRVATKATAVATLMADPPFAGRTPVYIGDDRTDEDAFAWVNDQSGGISIVVAPPGPSRASYHLDSVTDVHEWLRALARHLQTLE